MEITAVIFKVAGGETSGAHISLDLVHNLKRKAGSLEKGRDSVHNLNILSLNTQVLM